LGRANERTKHVSARNQKLVSKHFTADITGLCDAEKIQLFIYADKKRCITEILSSLVVAQEKHPDIGPLWHVTTPDAVYEVLFEAIRTFDRMIFHGVTQEEHHMLIALVCQHLELTPRVVVGDYLTVDGFQVLDGLQDPCLRLLAKSLAPENDEWSYIPFVNTTGLLQGSWIRIAEHMMKYHKDANSPSLLRLKASAWPAIADRAAGLCDDAPGSPQILAS